MDEKIRTQIENLRELRERLFRVDTINPPEAAVRIQASLGLDIKLLEDKLRAELFRLDRIIELWDYRSSYSQRVDREEILRALGVNVEEPERDTPRLNALMKEPKWVFDDPITVAEKAQVDMGPSLEEILLTGHDKALETWVGKLTPVQLATLRVMAPRLCLMIDAAYAKLPHMEYPEMMFTRRALPDDSVLRMKPRLPEELTKPLNDEEPGSFDD